MLSEINPTMKDNDYTTQITRHKLIQIVKLTKVESYMVAARAWGSRKMAIREYKDSVMQDE